MSDKCAIKLLDIFEILSLPVALDKLEGPDTTLMFLGFELHWKFVCQGVKRADSAMAGEEVMYDEGPGISYWEASTCGASSTTGENPS